MRSDGRVVDPTWRERGAFPSPASARQYLGIPLDSDFVRAMHSEHGMDSVLSCPEPLRELPPEAIAEPWQGRTLRA